MREYLKTLRCEKELSQLDIANSLDISLSYYNLIENGERQKDISLGILSKLSIALKTPLSELVQLENEYQKKICS